jgi:hypothetical protein
MPSLPDIPGKDLIDETTKRARAVAAGAATGALAVGGFLAKRALSRRGGDADTDAGPVAETPRPAARPEPDAPAPAPAQKPPAPPPQPKPKAAKPAPKPEKAKPAKPKPKAAKPEKPKPGKPKAAKPKRAAPPATTGTDAPTVPGAEPGDQRGGKDPHHSLNNPVVDPDPTEYPDPFDKREDPRAPQDPDGAPFGEEPHPATGAESTSEPPRSQDPEVGDRAKPPRRENLDD